LKTGEPNKARRHLPEEATEEDEEEDEDEEEMDEGEEMP
jgi:hypothetical protein